MDIERFTELADRLMDRVPPEVIEGLNGGVTVRRLARRNPTDPADVYILGEYITDPHLGCYVALYYGSFFQLFDGEPESVWEEELWITIKHELLHHLEARAGEHGLDMEDAETLERLQDELPPPEPPGPPRKFRLRRPLRPR